jgi:hypothetical protein
MRPLSPNISSTTCLVSFSFIPTLFLMCCNNNSFSREKTEEKGQNYQSNYFGTYASALGWCITHVPKIFYSLGICDRYKHIWTLFHSMVVWYYAVSNLT